MRYGKAERLKVVLRHWVRSRKWTFRSALGFAVLATCVLAMPVFSAAQSIRADFNNDGFEDLVIGVPNEKVGNIAAAGAVHVIYGRASGLSATSNQLWTLNNPSTNDHFGAALAAGDFNGDGFNDLGIGIPGDDQGADSNCGAIFVIDGGSTGLQEDTFLVKHTLFLTQGTFGMKGFRQDDDAFGSALAAGDFNGDGFDDLAVGVPQEDSIVYDLLPNSGAGNSGCVNVIFGSGRGLDVTSVFGDQTNDQIIQNSLGLLVSNQNMGASLASGDFDRDGFDDLAVGIPGDLVVAGGANFTNSGSVQVYFGTSEGFSPRIRPVHRFKVNGGNVSNLRFGQALTVGDFNGDLFDDLAIGSPFSAVAGMQAGVVRVHTGGLNGLNSAPTTFSQNSSGAVGVSQAGDEYGASIAAADFNADGFADLVIGVPGEDVSGKNNAGAVNVLYGKSTGLNATGSQEWHQDTAASSLLVGFPLDVDDVAEVNDQFGRTVTAGDFDGDGAADLVVGVPMENSGAGVVNVIYGGASSVGLTLFNGDTLWSQNSPGILGGSESGDQFGGALIGAPKAGPGGPGFSGIWETVQVKVTSRGNRVSSKIDGDLIVFNPGGEPAARSQIDVYLSSDSQLDPADELIQTVKKFRELKPGESRTERIKAKVKNMDANGMHLIAVLDATDLVPEANEENNVIVSDPMTSAANQLLQSLWQQFLAWLVANGLA